MPNSIENLKDNFYFNHAYLSLIPNNEKFFLSLK